MSFIVSLNVLCFRCIEPHEQCRIVFISPLFRLEIDIDEDIEYSVIEYFKRYEWIHPAYKMNAGTL